MSTFVIGFLFGAASLSALQWFVLWRMSRSPKAPKTPADYWLICPCMKERAQ